MKRNKGFTLVELLVVIAIIGILSSVVFASLGSARAKGKDANIKSNLSNIRAQAELIADGSTYANTCTDSIVLNMMTAAKTAAGVTAAVNTTLTTAGSDSLVTCHATALGYAIESPLVGTAGSSWCIDSTGVSSEKTGNIAASAIVCPSS